jgi:hypothetical protein
MNESKNILNENVEVRAKQTSSIAGIKGNVIIGAIAIKNQEDAFKITVAITNTTPVEDAAASTRDEALFQSFLSTHTILQTANAKFISQQNPPAEFVAATGSCENKNTWPILIDTRDTTLLSSPVILYDHPQINSQSHGDLFDSTEIEEALLLHVNLLSAEEKKRIGESDEKLQAMLHKVSEISPGELINFHSSLKESKDPIINSKNDQA